MHFSLERIWYLTLYLGKRCSSFMDFWKTVEELIKELLKAAPENYEETKFVLLAVTQNPRLLEFLEEMFSLVEEKRPLLIEMK